MYVDSCLFFCHGEPVRRRPRVAERGVHAMTMQPALFHECLDDAIRDTVMAMGGNKRVGNLLWPALPADVAGKRLADCLNADKRDKLSPDELALIRREARKQGAHILATYEMRDAGYADPLPIAPEDEAAQLQREYIAAVKAMGELQARISRNPLLTRAA